ncbi:MAG TPA: response regulator transcription factor, partial [Oceanipulchritudo sp.]|nr:response regulator transcription factor [Oceanipulchritudo sp.]
MKIKRILVVEDETMFREFLTGWFEAEGYEILGSVGTLGEAEAITVRREDLVVLDLDLPDGDGMGYVERQAQRDTGTRILVLTAHVGNHPVVRLKKSGIMGALDKAETSGAELRRALESIENWRTYYSERIEIRFRQLIRESSAFYKTLSPREEEMLKQFGLGNTNEVIADGLGLSVATV